jgi:hypothetical protein
MTGMNILSANYFLLKFIPPSYSVMIWLYLFLHQSVIQPINLIFNELSATVKTGLVNDTSEQGYSF